MQIEIDNFWIQILIAFLAVIVALKYYFQHSKNAKFLRLQEEWNEAAGSDVVVLHMFDRAIHCPNPSPFPIKLETWLRVNNVKYITDFKEQMSSKGKSPWITINGKNIADSQLAIDHLQQELRIDSNADLNREQKAIARAVRILLEEHLYFIIVVERYIHERGIHVLDYYPPLGIPKFLLRPLLHYAAPYMLGKAARAQGTGRHSREQVQAMGMKAFESISDILGEKKYLTGDRICEEDCTLFGFTTWLLYNVPETDVFQAAVKDKFVNIVRHQERVKAAYWKDWDTCKYGRVVAK